MMKNLVFLAIILLLLIGCSDDYHGRLSQEQVFEMHPDASIIEIEGIVYAELDWLYDEMYTKDNFIGEIEEGMANDLPVGSEIYRAKEYDKILLIDVNGETKRYMGQFGE